MIKKIILFIMPILLFTAILLKLNGVDHVEIGQPFLSFLNKVSIDMSKWKFDIPSIPMIDSFDSPSGWLLVLDFLINVINGLSTLINVIISLLNVLISVLQFIFTMIYDFKDFITILQNV